MLANHFGAHVTDELYHLKIHLIYLISEERQKKIKRIKGKRERSIEDSTTKEIRC